MAKVPETLRWTVKLGAAEYGTNERTIKSRLNKLGIIAGKDGMFSTQQVHAGACLHDENVRRIAAAEAEVAEMDLAERQQKLISVDALAPVINRVIAAIKARIDSASNLEREDKDKILLELGKLWDSAFGVAPSPVGAAQADAANVEPSAKV